MADDDINISDFEAEMRRLAAEVEPPAPAEPTPTAAPRASSSAGSEKAFLTAITQLLRPVNVSLSSVDQRTRDLSTTLDRLEQLTREATEKVALIPTAPPPAPVVEPSPAPPELGQILHLVETQGRVEGANQKLFDALHQELKGYKELFLFESLQKPMIRDMLALYDDLCAVEAQGKQFNKANEGTPASAEELKEFLGHLLMNLENLRVLFMEVFDRLEVEQIKTEKGKMDKRTQKAISIQPTSVEAEDGQVARKIRPGFTWRGDRVIRPEDVVIKRYNAGAPAADEE